MATPTQVRHPWRSSLRTAVQTFIPLIVALLVTGPEIVEAFADVPTEGAAWATAAGIAAGLSAVAGALARLFAIPAVERLLEKLGLDTGVKNEPLPPDPVEEGL